MVTAYKPEIELFTSGIAFAAMLTVKDGTSTVDVWLEQREAREADEEWQRHAQGQ